MHHLILQPSQYEMEPVPPHPGHQQEASSVLYTTSCKHSLALLRMSGIIARDMLSWLKLLIKFLLFYLVGCLYNYISDARSHKRQIYWTYSDLLARKTVASRLMSCQYFGFQKWHFCDTNVLSNAVAGKAIKAVLPNWTDKIFVRDTA